MHGAIESTDGDHCQALSIFDNHASRLGVVNETLQPASFFKENNGTLAKVATEGEEMPTSPSEGGTHRIIEILQPAEVERPGVEQSSNLYGYGSCKELSNEVANLISMSPATGTSAATAIKGDRPLEGSPSDAVEYSTRPDQDLENGGVPSESTGGGVAVDASSGDYHQDNDDGCESECRICQMSSATDVIINLGCRCKMDLARAHGVCAETWFRFKGNRQCEICGETAFNVQEPEVMGNNSLSRLGTSIVGNGHLPVGGFERASCWWNLENILTRHTGKMMLIVIVVGGVSFFFTKFMPAFTFKG